MQVDPSRKYDRETVKTFQLCTAPGGNAFLQHARSQNWDLEDLKEMGLLGHNAEKGRYYDFWRDRLLFPLFDQTNALLGFAGRDLTGRARAKYLNPPATPLYDKGRFLCGLKQAQQAIKDHNRAFVVEGYTDAVTAHEKGFRNFVAKCGGHLSKGQALLLKRYCDEVVLVAEGDVARVNENGIARVASLESVKKDIETCIRVGLYVKILILQPDRDTGKKDYPDSFLRSKGPKAWRDLCEGIQDALIWLVVHDVNTGDNDSILKGMKRAAELISHMKDEEDRNFYVAEITKPNRLKAQGKNIQQSIRNHHVLKLRKKKGEKDRPGLTSTQKEMLEWYGVCMGDDNRFYKRKNNDLLALSNFIIKPLYHIGSNLNPERVMVITNTHDHSFTVQMPASTCVKFPEFEQLMTNKGNFRFSSSCRSHDFKNIMAFVAEEMTQVVGISTLGYHAKKDFYSFNNGIVIDGLFQKANKHGMVERDSINFILPGQHFKNLNEDAYDDLVTEDSHIENFTYTIPTSGITFKKWASKFCQVYGSTGVIGLAWYLSALFRDFIHPRVHGFPILNFVGLPGTGKTTCGRSLAYLGGRPIDIVDLSNTTKPGLGTALMQIRNFIVHLDEYDNNRLDEWVYGILKTIFDGTGRNKKSLNKRNSTERDQVLSAVILSGQHFPTREPAMPSRCITLTTDYKRNEEKEKQMAELNEMEMTGELATFTARAQKYRPDVIEHFDRVREEMKREITPDIEDGDNLITRVLYMHIVPLTVCTIFERAGFEFPEIGGRPFNEKLREYLTDAINHKVAMSVSSGEVARFWNAFQGIVDQSRPELVHDEHFRVDMTIRISLKTGRKSSEKRAFEEPRKLLFIMNPTKGHIYGCYS